jgi:hypothetical protein
MWCTLKARRKGRFAVLQACNPPDIFRPIAMVLRMLDNLDVIMMQGDGKGIAMRPEHRKGAGKSDSARSGTKNMAEIVAVADFTPPSASRRTSPPCPPAARTCPVDHGAGPVVIWFGSPALR